MRCAKGDTKWYKDQEYIDRVARQGLPGGISEACWPTNPSPLIFVQRLAIGVLEGTMQEGRMFVDVVVQRGSHGFPTILG